jgi:hypothetical protein
MLLSDKDEDNLWASESRLNRFLKRLGRALESTKKRGEFWVLDWQKNVNRTLSYIVQGWCKRIRVDGELWPPLCCLSTPALAKFLTLCKVPPGQAPLWNKEKETGLPKQPRTLEQEIRRMKLVRIPKGRIKEVEKKFGQFRFR